MKNFTFTSALILIVGLLLTTTFSFAAEKRSLENGKITVTFPEGWIVKGNGFGSVEMAEKLGITPEELRKRWEPYGGNVLIAHKEFNEKNTFLTLSYGTEHGYTRGLTEGYPSFEETPLLYHKKAGKEIVKCLINISITRDHKGITYGKAEGYHTKTCTYVNTHAWTKSNFFDIYYTVLEDGVVIAFVLENDEIFLSEAEILEAEKIIESFKDLGYHKEFNNNYGVMRGIDFVPFTNYRQALILFLGVVLYLCIVIIVAVKRDAKERKRKLKASHSDGGGDPEEWSDKMTDRKVNVKEIMSAAESVVDKKAIVALKDERHGVWLQVIFCFIPLTCCMVIGIFLLGYRIILQQESFFIFTASPGILTYILNVLLYIVLIWGTVWVIKIDVVNIKYINKLNKAIQAGKRKDFEEFIKREAICEAYYEKFFVGKGVAPVPPPIIGKLSKKKKQ